MGFLDKHKDEVDILFQIIKSYIKEKFDVELDSFDNLNTNSRKRPLVYARKYIMIILVEIFNKEPHKYIQEEIAETVGLDRTSLIYHFKTHLNDYTYAKGYKEEYDKMRDEFLEKIKE